MSHITANSKSADCPTCKSFPLNCTLTRSSKSLVRSEKHSDFRYIPCLPNLQYAGPLTMMVSQTNTGFKRPSPPLQRIKTSFTLVFVCYPLIFCSVSRNGNSPNMGNCLVIKCFLSLLYYKQ